MSLGNFNFANHRNKCRCCFRVFDEEDDQIKVTKIVQNRFLEFTHLELEAGDTYSSHICGRCNKELRSFSLRRKELVFKHLSFHEFVEDLRITEGRRDPSDLEDSEETQTLTQQDDEDMAESAEIKVETGEYVFNDGTTVNFLTPAPATARNLKMFRNPESKAFGGQSTSQMRHSAQASNDGEVDMSQHELFGGLEDHPVQRTQEPEPRKRGRPRKGQERKLGGTPVKSGKKKVDCFVCGKSFSCEQAFQFHHEAVHLKIKRFECDIGGMKFYKKAELRVHLSRHIEGKPVKSASNDCNCYDNTRPFACNVKGCGKFFKTEQNLKLHSTTHSDKFHKKKL